MADINQRLASLYTDFKQNVLADEEGLCTFVDKESELEGLSDDVRKAAAAAAERRGKKGQWAFDNTRSSVEPVLTYAKNRALREKVWRHYVRRGDNGDSHDNKRIITEILKLRLERARLLGYPTHAHYRLEDTMAKSPDRAMSLMEAMWKPAVARVKEEVREMEAVAKKEGATAKIAPWDYRYYAEKVRKAKYDLDEDSVKPYLQLEKLREGMFWVAGELLGLSFKEVTGVETYHPDVRVFEVKGPGDKLVGLWYFDPYARAGKQSGAWMNAYREQERFRGEVLTLVSNNSNFVKGGVDGTGAAEPVLISWDDARTLFHEFGHALHGLCSNVTYPSLSGTNVSRDYVEFPSQLLESWLSTPEVLERFAVHYKTGKPLPKEVVRKIDKAKNFNQGFATVEYLASALVDMKMHLEVEGDVDPDAFEKRVLGALGMPSEIVMRHRAPHFGHIFAGDGYSAGYYSYLWSDTLSSDAFEAFLEGKGPYDRTVAEKLRAHVFSVGDTVDPADGYRAFRGKDAGIDALLRRRGFATPAPASRSKPGAAGR
jgi:peptidyl-dipeptidase Dcp